MSTTGARRCGGCILRCRGFGLRPYSDGEGTRLTPFQAINQSARYSLALGGSLFVIRRPTFATRRRVDRIGYPATHRALWAQACQPKIGLCQAVRALCRRRAVNERASVALAPTLLRGDMGRACPLFAWHTGQHVWAERRAPLSLPPALARLTERPRAAFCNGVRLDLAHSSPHTAAVSRSPRWRRRRRLTS